MKLAKESGLPQRFRQASWTDYSVTEQNEQALKKCRWFVQTPGASLYIYGTFGSGKTLLATLAAKEFLRLGKSVVFGEVQSLLDTIKETYERKELSTAQVLSRYGECDLLILDDLGRGVQTPWQVKIIEQLINQRYNGEKAILVTSNFEVRELKKRWSFDPDNAEAIISRLWEMCEFGYSGSQDYRMRMKK